MPRTRAHPEAISERSIPMKRFNSMVYITIIPLFIFVALFLIVPLFTMISGSFQADGGGGFTFDQYKEIFTNPYYGKAFENSILISLLSSLAGIAAAVFAAYAITRCWPLCCYILCSTRFRTAGRKLRRCSGLPRSNSGDASVCRCCFRASPAL